MDNGTKMSVGPFVPKSFCPLPQLVQLWPTLINFTLFAFAKPQAAHLVFSPHNLLKFLGFRSKGPSWVFKNIVFSPKGPTLGEGAKKKRGAGVWDLGVSEEFVPTPKFPTPSPLSFPLRAPVAQNHKGLLNIDDVTMDRSQ